MALEQHQQHDEAHRLAQRRGQPRAGHAHVQAVDEDRVADHVQDRAQAQADHGVEGHALVAQHVVEHQRGDEHRCGGEDVHAVVPGVGEDGGCAAHRAHQRVDQRYAQQQKQRAHADGQEEAGGGVVGGCVRILLRQKTGDHAARAVAQHEADGLQHRHQREHHAHRAAGAHPQRAHEVGVRQVVDVRDEHADDRRHGQRDDQALHRGLRHLPIVQFRLRHGRSLRTN